MVHLDRRERAAAEALSQVCPSTKLVRLSAHHPGGYTDGFAAAESTPLGAELGSHQNESGQHPAPDAGAGDALPAPQPPHPVTM